MSLSPHARCDARRPCSSSKAFALSTPHPYQVEGCKNHGILYVGPSARGAVRSSVVEKCKLNGM